MISLGLGSMIISAVFATSILSGVFGFAGGMILMGIYVATLPVGLAMVLHGYSQLFANGFRFLGLVKHVMWKQAGFYAAGAMVAIAAFWGIAFNPSKPMLFLMLGLMLFIALIPKLPRLDFRKPAHAFFCGIVNSIAHVTAGVSGPILDVFFVSGSMSRFQVISTKAFTQSLSHALKIAYFSIAVGQAEGDAIPMWLMLAVPAAALAGTKVGAVILEKMSDASFLLYTRRLLMGVGAVYVCRAVIAWL